MTTAETLVEGRGGFTGHAAEIGMLKTPTLRNIDSTGPYFHGSKNSLHDVVDHFDGGFLDVVSPKGTLDRFILPLDLTAAEKDALVAFLESLSGTEPDNDP